MKKWWKLGAAIALILALTWVLVPRPRGTMKVQDSADPTKYHTLVVRPAFDVHLKHDGVAVAWSGDSACFAVTSFYGGYINVFDRTGHPIGRQIGAVSGPNVDHSLAVLSGCREVLFHPPRSNMRGTDPLAFWDVITGQPTRFLLSPDVPNRQGSNWAYSFTLSQDEKRITTLVSAKHFIALVYDIETSEPKTIPLQKRDGSSITIFPDHKRLALANYNGTFSIIDLENDDVRKIYEIPDYYSNLGDVDIGDIAVSPDGEKVLLGLRAAYPKYDINIHGNRQINAGSNEWVMNLPPVKVIRLIDGRELASFQHWGLQRPIRQVQWDPKNRFTAFVDSTGTVFLWKESEPIDSIITIGFTENTYSFKISPDGTRIAMVHGTTVSVFSIE